MRKSKKDGSGKAHVASTINEPLYVNRPVAVNKQGFLSRFDEIWDARWFTNDGPMVQELEHELAKYLGVGHCVLASNGTAAMGLLIDALGLGGKVVLPAFTFVSTAHLLALRRMEPVFCDIYPDGHDLSVEHCQELLSDETSAVIATHIWGRPAKIESLQALCDEAGIPLIFDAAHAFGTRHGERMIGRFGRAEVFSFHATKLFHTFEGGAVTTECSELAERLRQLRNFGFTEYDQVDCIGTNAKMSEVHAAMGLANLESIESIMMGTRDVYEAYERGLRSIEGLTLARPRSKAETNNYYVPVLVDEAKFGVTRDKLVSVLHSENVLVRRYFYPGSHRLAPYKAIVGDMISLPVTDFVSERIMVLPGGASLTVEDVEAVCSLLERIHLKHADKGDRPPLSDNPGLG
ncbi:aminotransferase class I/II-fold pyridoxal phosphate-dependent enzyme [Maricaulis parjimensis]|uniref:aminotransferase class I/II-fold pyridoxal phosphate-dependent enzyme n=1 Tax=Maricaulis parjimensis TaxID=144023 RepID=UPI00193ACE7A|nr:aminotransferase class I/II-fold pyridoxal phosphate-dependent enzyme [Maricaulis parjimensis]